MFLFEDNIFQLSELFDERSRVFDELNITDDLILLFSSGGSDLKFPFKLFHSLINEVNFVVGRVDLLLCLGLLVFGIADLTIEHLNLLIDNFSFGVLLFHLVE